MPGTAASSLRVCVSRRRWRSSSCCGTRRRWALRRSALSPGARIAGPRRRLVGLDVTSPAAAAAGCLAGSPKCRAAPATSLGRPPFIGLNPLGFRLAEPVDGSSSASSGSRGGDGGGDDCPELRAAVTGVGQIVPGRREPRRHGVERSGVRRRRVGGARAADRETPTRYARLS